MNIYLLESTSNNKEMFKFQLGLYFIDLTMIVQYEEGWFISILSMK